MFEIVFSRKADSTFDSIQSQLMARWGQDVVIAFERRAWKVINKLSESPFIYQSIKGNTQVRKAVLHKNCSMYYKVKGQEVVILFFWDNRQDPIFL